MNRMNTSVVRSGLLASVAALAIGLVCAMTMTQAAWASQFPDVPDDHWAQQSGIVDKAVSTGLIKGVTADDGTSYFMPDNEVTRAQVAVMLSRMAGNEASEPYPTNQTSWSDVADCEWYTGAMNWASDNGVLNGSGGIARPNDPITREELTCVLANYRNAMGEGDVSGDTSLLALYSDGYQVSVWADESVAWAIGEGIIGGSATLNPAGYAKRAETAKMILVACGFIEGSEPPSEPVPAPTPDPAPAPAPAPDPNPAPGIDRPSGPDMSTMVCVTKSGKKYHYDWCPTLSRSKNLTYMTAAEAASRGYGVCKDCKPPAA